MIQLTIEQIRNLDTIIKLVKEKRLKRSIYFEQISILAFEIEKVEKNYFLANCYSVQLVKLNLCKIVLDQQKELAE